MWDKNIALDDTPLPLMGRGKGWGDIASDRHGWFPALRNNELMPS
jgi:hypothetical protein